MHSQPNFIQLYQENMQEIKNRIHVLLSITTKRLQGASLTGYHQSDIDLGYLQIRKIFELMMFASLVVQPLAGHKLTNRIKKEYNAEKLLKFMLKLNPDFFPSPKIGIAVERQGLNMVDLTDRQNSEVDPHLTQDEFKAIYTKKLGNFAHASRNDAYGSEQDMLATLEEIEAIRGKTVRLLEHHMTNLGHDQFVMTVMAPNGDENVNCTLFGRSSLN